MSQSAISVELLGSRIETPLIAASGTFGGIQPSVIPLKSLGAIVLKSATADLRKGNPPPRIHETPAGVLNSIGLENPGIDKYLLEEIPHYSGLGVPLIASISGKTPEEFAMLAGKLRAARKIIALEINLSCPNVSGGLDFSTVPSITSRVTRDVKAAFGGKVIAKLTPNVTDVVEIARAAVEGGADAISAINTVLATSFDWKSGRPIIANVLGGLSGPAIKPIALRIVWQIHKKLPAIPIIGIGGIMSAADVLEFFCAGACAVQVGTGLFSDPTCPDRICAGLRESLAYLKLGSLKEYAEYLGKKQVGI